MDYSVQYYDLVLVGIFGSVALGALVGYATAVETVIAIVVASALAVGLIAHALFVNGPVDELDDLTREVEQVGPVELPE